MRTRLVLLVVAILLIAAFAALNWSEVVRPAPLLFGPVVVNAPLGGILLTLLALTIVVFALSAGALRTHHLMESRRYARELEAQRSLANKAEASRYTELRQMMDEHLRHLGERDMALSHEWQRELHSEMEASNRMLSARLNEFEHRLEARFERMGLPRATPVTSAGAPREAAAEEARAARSEERMAEREDREVRREERATASEAKAESGWRKWF